MKRAAEAIAYRQLGDTFAVSLVDIGRMVFLNESAGTILALIDAGASRAVLLEKMKATFDVEEEILAADIDAALAFSGLYC